MVLHDVHVVVYSQLMDVPHNPVEDYVIAQIRAEMAVLQWSQTDLAAKAGISRDTLGRYLRGTRTIPLDVFLGISGALGIEAHQLMARAEKRAESLTEHPERQL